MLLGITNEPKYKIKPDFNRFFVVTSAAIISVEIDAGRMQMQHAYAIKSSTYY
jgi:hypothetical protein